MKTMTKLTKQDIINTLVFYDRFFPQIKGDVGTREEIAEKLASEMLSYDQHALWKDVNELHPCLPQNYHHKTHPNS